MVFVRSPCAHAGIRQSDPAAARAAPSVAAAFTGPELEEIWGPCVGVPSQINGLEWAPRHALAVDATCRPGEAVTAFVAASCAAAEDAAAGLGNFVCGVHARCHRVRGQSQATFLRRLTSQGIGPYSMYLRKVRSGTVRW